MKFSIKDLFSKCDQEMNHLPNVSTQLKHNVFIKGKYVTLYAILYHMCNLKNLKNTHGNLLLETLFHGYFSRFLNCRNGTISRKIKKSFKITLAAAIFLDKCDTAYLSNQLTEKGNTLINPSLVNVSILFPLKTQVNQSFLVFSGSIKIKLWPETG